MKSIRERKHKVTAIKFGMVPPAHASAADMAKGMPLFLAAKDLRVLAEAIRAASDEGAPVVFAVGGHVVKTGCSPYLIDLMRRGYVTNLAMNGAAAIHDAEIAMHGETSEDVDETLRTGEFGMASETMELFDAACQEENITLGGGLVRQLGVRGTPFGDYSLLCSSDSAPTVHVAIGADTVHMSPNADGAALGRSVLADFRRLCSIVATFDRKSAVWINMGCATLLPEVFMKAVSDAIRNGADLDSITTADMDMIKHYRPTENVVRRPPGTGVQITGHHEIMIPLLHQMIIS